MHIVIQNIGDAMDDGPHGVRAIEPVGNVHQEMVADGGLAAWSQAQFMIERRVPESALFLSALSEIAEQRRDLFHVVEVTVLDQLSPLSVGEQSFLATVDVVLESPAASPTSRKRSPMSNRPRPDFQFIALGEARLRQVGKCGGGIGLGGGVPAIAPPHSKVIAVPSWGELRSVHSQSTHTSALVEWYLHNDILVQLAESLLFGPVHHIVYVAYKCMRLRTMTCICGHL